MKELEIELVALWRPLIKEAIKQHIVKGNPLQKRLRDWKTNQAIKAESYEDFLKILKTKKKAVIQHKVDGETGIAGFDGSSIKFSTIGGRMISDLPLIDELESKLKGAGVKQAIIIGERVGVDEKGNLLKFDEVMDLIRDPANESEAKRIWYYPFELVEFNDKKFDKENLGDIDVYLDGFSKMKNWFGGAKYIHPSLLKVGGEDVFKTMWKDWVVNKMQEGLVVRLGGGDIFKIKSFDFWDLGIIGAEEGKGRLKGKLGAVLTAFMDKDKIFRFAGKVGSGFSDEDREEYWDWITHNEADIDKESQEKLGKGWKEVRWIKPQKVIQVRRKGEYPGMVDSFSFSKGKFNYEGEKPGAIQREPRFEKERDDKTINHNDLRLEQIENWAKKEKEIVKEKTEEVFYESVDQVGYVVERAPESQDDYRFPKTWVIQ